MAQNKDFLCFKTRIKTRQTKQNKARQGQPRYYLSTFFSNAILDFQASFTKRHMEETGPGEALGGFGNVDSVRCGT